MDAHLSSKTSRRRLLYMFGLGSVGAIVAADNLFAKLFASDATPVKLPDMVYDADLQMMVDPSTRRPLYARAEMLDVRGKKMNAEDSNETEGKSDKAKPLPTVTAGCSDCPKCDDNCG